jgi:hypothetical protein
MDATLNAYCARVKEIKENINIDKCTLIDMVDINNYMAEVTTMQQYLNDTINTVKMVYNDLLARQVQVNILNQPQVIQSKIYTDNLVINNKYFNQSNTKIIEVNHIYDIPEMPLYWISSLKQYGINIGGMVLRGNIGNIYNSSMVAKNKLLSNIIYCKNYNMCDKILSGQQCRYYHDPAELYILKNAGLITSDQFDLQVSYRNFINTSWIYTEYPERASNANMRHFGSREYLKQYIQLNKIEKGPRISTYCRNYADQCMHDILVMFAMYTNELFNPRSNST